MKKSLLVLSAMLIAASAFAATPPEQVPRPQNIQIVQHGVVDQTVGGVAGAQLNQQQMLMQQLVKQRQFDPPVLIKTVLQPGPTSLRTPWLDANATPLGITKLEPLAAAKSPNIPNLWDLAILKQLAPVGIRGGSGDITASNGGGSSCIDRMPDVALIT
jgi:hypothetical protein